MNFISKHFGKQLSKVLSGKKKAKADVADEIPQGYWDNIKKNVDEPFDQLIWNKNVPIDKFKKTEFVKFLYFTIDKQLEFILHHNNIRVETDHQNIKLNILFLSIYSYAASKTIVDGLIFYIILLLLSYLICYLWYHTLKTCFMQNVASFAVIRKCQEFLPMKVYGDAVPKLIQLLSNTHQHPGFFSSMLLAKSFAILYTIVFIFYLLTNFLK